jgi:hypothetical protein
LTLNRRFAIQAAMPPEAREASGVFAALEIPSVVRRVMAGSPAGRLRVGQRGTNRFVWFEGDRVRAITSSLEEERLGSWLVARGLVGKQAMHDVLIRKPKDERFGNALIRARLIEESRLTEELGVLSLHIAGRMLFEDGSWEVEGGWEIPPDAVVLDLPGSAMFVLAIRRAPDTGQFERLAGGGRRWVALGVPEAEGIELLPLERLVLTLLGGPRTLEELRESAPQQSRELPRALAILASAGQARWEGGTGPGSRPGDDEPQYPPASPRLREMLHLIDPEGGRRRVARHAAGGAGAGGPAVELTQEDLERLEEDKRQGVAILQRGGDPRLAYKLLQPAVDAVPDADHLVVLAEIEISNPLWRQRALDHLKLAMVLNPQLTPGWLALANYWGLRGQPEKQRRCLEKILVYNPANTDVLDAIDLLDRQG